MPRKNNQSVTDQGPQYQAWRGEPLAEVEREMLALIVKHWRAGTPLNRETANYELVQAGFPFKEVSPTNQRLIQRRPPVIEHLQHGERFARPRLAALIELGDDESTADLRLLGRIVESMHKAYRPDRKEVTVEELANAAKLGAAELQRLAPLTDLYGGGAAVTLDEQVLGWTTFSEFLESRLNGPSDETRFGVKGDAKRRRSREEEAPPDLLLDFRPSSISWAHLGPYEEATLELTPLTILVGANGVGKTSALKVLELLREVSSGVESDGASLFRRGAAEISFQLHGELHRQEQAAQRAQWETSLLVVPRYAVKSERLTVDERVMAQLTFGAGWWINDAGARQALNLRPDQLAIREAKEPQQQTALMGIRQQVARWVVMSQGELGEDPAVMTDRGFGASELRTQTGLKVKLLQDAAAAVLGPLTLERGYANNAISYVDARGHAQSLDQAPRGIAHVVTILAHLMQPNPPPLLAIDEIERHLHANVLERLIDVMRGFTHRTRIVLTTHSSTVLRASQVEELRLVRSGKAASSIVSIKNDPRLQRLVATGELGRLLDQGYFAEAP